MATITRTIGTDRELQRMLSAGLTALGEVDRLAEKLGGRVGRQLAGSSNRMRNAPLAVVSGDGLGWVWLIPAGIVALAGGDLFVRIRDWLGGADDLAAQARCIDRALASDPTLTPDQAAALCRSESGVPQWVWGAGMGIGVVLVAALLLRRRR